MFMSGSGYRQIDSGTWRTYWCAQTELPSTFAACAGVQQRVQLLPIVAGAAGAAVLALLAFLTVRLARKRRSA
jgi:hypothetical protein